MLEHCVINTKTWPLVYYNLKIYIITTCSTLCYWLLDDWRDDIMHSQLYCSLSPTRRTYLLLYYIHYAWGQRESLRLISQSTASVITWFRTDVSYGNWWIGTLQRCVLLFECVLIHTVQNPLGPIWGLRLPRDGEPL